MPAVPESSPAPPPVFVLGSRRSGATLLGRMLSAHPRIGISAESGFLPDLIRRSGRGPIDVALLESRASGKARWGENLSGLQDALPAIDGHFPSAQYIHIVRDGRAVLASRRGETAISVDPIVIAGEWVEVQERIGDLARGLPPSRYLRVRYEDLVTEPARALRSVCDYLGEPFVAEMVDRESVTSSTLDAWRGEVTAADEARFMVVAGRTMATLGYEDLDVDLPLGEWAKVVVRSRRRGSGPRLLPYLIRRAGRVYTLSAATPQRGKGRIASALGRVDHDGRRRVLTEFRPGLWAALDLGSHVERPMYYEGFYRPWLIPPFEGFLSDGAVVFDIGANVGAYSLVAARRVGVSGRVVAVEPASFPFAKLVRNVQLNGLHNVIALRIAVGERDGTALLHSNPVGDANEAQASLTHMDMHGRAEEITIRALDSLMEEHALLRLDGIKMDAQGGELGVLRGAARTIAAHHPSIMLRCHEEKCRAFGDGSEDLQRWLLERGYRIRVLATGRRPSGRESARHVWVGDGEELRPLEDATLLAVHRSRA